MEMIYNLIVMFSKELFKEISASHAPQKLLIVPAQLTLSAEMAAFAMLKKEGFLDFHVMSGNKLRAEIINKTGSNGRLPIDTLGRSMILRKCARDASLEVYAKSSSSPEFLKAAGDFILQLKQNMEGIPQGESGILNGKLSDMSKIYKAYESYMSGKYTDSEDALLFAAEQVRKCEWIKNSEIWFAGFYSFTKREHAFLKALDESSLGCHIVDEKIVEKFPTTLCNVIKAGGPLDQVNAVASEILRLIREESYKAEDIAILSGDIGSDSKLFKRVFDSIGIPSYTDEKHSLMHTEAAARIVALLDMMADGYKATSVSNFVNSEEFDNYIKSYHIKGKAFLSPFKYGGDRKIEAEKIRDDFVNLIIPFAEEFTSAKTVLEKTSALYRFLTDAIHMPEAIHETASLFEAGGYVQQADEQNQLWSVIVNIFDQAVELLGSEKMSSIEYRDIIKDAFKDVKIGMLPQQSGSVVIGDIYRTKINDVKVLFVTSFNDGCIPRNNNAEGILTEAEQKRLFQKGIVLCKAYEQLNKEDRLCIYQAFDAATEKLYLTCKLSNDEGLALKASYLLNTVNPKIVAIENANLYSLEALIERLREFKTDGKALGDDWKTVAYKFKDTCRYKAAVQGLMYKNNDRYLSKDAKDKLLRPKDTSPSGLEKYARCPYSYFISHGIRPWNNDDFKINQSDLGTLHHEILSRLSTYLSSDGLPVSSQRSRWMTSSDEEISKFINETADKIIAEDSSGLMSKGPEEEYRINRAKSLVLDFACQMLRQVRLGNIDQIRTEEEFSLTFAGTKIKGKIDRVDLTMLSDKNLVKVIDYKSGNIIFDKKLIEKGLALQLMIYLEAASSSGEKPIGTFYFHINRSDTAVDIDKLSDTTDQNNAVLDGAYVDDKLIYIDKTTTAGAASEIVKKNLSMSEDEYEALRVAFRDKLNETVDKLLRGNISVSPKNTGSQSSSCTYCQYKSICAFDSEIEGYVIE